MGFAGKDGMRVSLVKPADFLQEFCITIRWTAFPEFDADFLLHCIKLVRPIEKESIDSKHVRSLFLLALIGEVVAFATSEIWTGCI